MSEETRLRLKQRLKSFFKADQTSDAAVELLQYFIIPFSRGMKHAGVDDVVYARANRDFKLPGKYFGAGNRPIYGLGPRAVKGDQTMMLVLDRVDETVKVELKLNGSEHNYLLEKFEFETIKDWIDVIEE